MILVTLGTHPQPMDRLVQKLDELVASREISDHVVVQVAALGYRPRHLEVLPVIPYAQLVDLIERADAVVCHAGPATLAIVRLAGKVPVVVPRSRTQGEHVDDHQEFYGRRLATLRGYIVVSDVDYLAEALATARTSSVERGRPDVSEAVRVLNGIVECNS